MTFTIALVVFADQGARGLLLGNFGASAIVVLGLWWVLRRRFSLRAAARATCARCSHFGLPTVPADASVYALQVVDRFYLFRSYSHAAAGLYAVAIKLATVVFVAVRGFQYAWPPLAYSIESDEEAARLYSLVTTYYALATGVVVCARRPARRAGWCGCWRRREFFGAYRALPWLALGWALYGLYLVFVAIAGRARVTSRNLAAAVGGLAVNIALLLVLVPGRGRRASGSPAPGSRCAAPTWRCCVVIYLLTREPVQRRLRMARLAQLDGVFAAVAVSGELLLPTRGRRRAARARRLARARAGGAAAHALLPPARAGAGAGAARRRPPARGRASAPATARSRPTPRTRCATCETARLRRRSGPGGRVVALGGLAQPLAALGVQRAPRRGASSARAACPGSTSAASARTA